MLEYVDISEKVQFFIFEFLFGNFQLVLQGMNFLQKKYFTVARNGLWLREFSKKVTLKN